MAKWIIVAMTATITVITLYVQYLQNCFFVSVKAGSKNSVQICVKTPTDLLFVL